MFQLDPRLGNDTVPVTSLDLCRVLLMNDARYPWLILVPARDGLSELHDLTAADQLLLNDEIMRASRAMMKLFTPEKINVGTLGNIVRQLHIHVVARRTDDPAWPGPVWGHSPAELYAAEQIADMQLRLAAVFAPRNAGV
mgnify:CR=1 FL=1